MINNKYLMLRVSTAVLTLALWSSAATSVLAMEALDGERTVPTTPARPAATYEQLSDLVASPGPLSIPGLPDGETMEDVLMGRVAMVTTQKNELGEVAILLATKAKKQKKAIGTLRGQLGSLQSKFDTLQTHHTVLEQTLESSKQKKHSARAAEAQDQAERIARLRAADAQAATEHKTMMTKLIAALKDGDENEEE